MIKKKPIREEEWKNVVKERFFGKFDCTKIIDNIDFAVKQKTNMLPLFNDPYFLWAEAKAEPSDIHSMLTQLILTIGKQGTIDDINPPPFLGCFDSEKLALVPYHCINGIFYRNDINWKTRPSDWQSEGFQKILLQVRQILDANANSVFVFDLKNNEIELRQFIKNNFVIGSTEAIKIQIDKNNFILVYNKWLEAVKPTIRVNWETTKKIGIIDGDFYLADLLSRENKTLKEKLFVILKIDEYELARHVDALGLDTSSRAGFTDDQKAHTRFWAKYERPPLEDYWDYIIERRDLLVPQDIRERKGSFFTPRKWVELSQKYIADVLGENWQDEHYVWDCAAGTGNLLAGLTNKYNIWASTIDQADVDVMKDRIDNGANLLKEHVFRFDFLNEDFTELPKGLQGIINDPEKRKKLVVYINPPYAESMNKKISRNSKQGVHRTLIEAKYSTYIGKSVRELFVQFLARIYYELQGCKIANFSTIKILQSPNFINFRANFQCRLERLFLVPANTFDNVKGHFPVGFFFWDTNIQTTFNGFVSHCYDGEGNFLFNRNIIPVEYDMLINVWFKKYIDKEIRNEIAAMCCIGNDFQHNNFVNINHRNQLKGVGNAKGIAKFGITSSNIIVASIYYSVRKCISSTWLNDRDQFLYPHDSWKEDAEFHTDCLAFALFNNNISSKFGTNHWIPFRENDVDASTKFDSNFMTDYIAGKIVPEEAPLYARTKQPLAFSPQAQDVFDAGKALWKYYHSWPKVNVNASLYEIREHFKGRDATTGKMNNRSTDPTFNGLEEALRNALRTLAAKLAPKIYEHGFLR